MEKENSGMERDDAGGQVREGIQGRVLRERLTNVTNVVPRDRTDPVLGEMCRQNNNVAHHQAISHRSLPRCCALRRTQGGEKHSTCPRLLKCISKE